MAAMNQGGIISKTAAEAVKASKPKTLRDMVEQMMPEIKRALPSTITAERFTRIVYTALSNNPTLAKCDKNSFLGAMISSAQLGLEVNTSLGEAYLLPYYDNRKGVYNCQFQKGLYGVIKLCRNEGITVDAKVVYSNDEFELEFGLNPVLKHKPALKDRGSVVGYYAVWKSKDGAFGFEFMNPEDCEKHGRRYSKSYDKGPWSTNFDSMCLKTVILKALKYAPKSAELKEKLDIDNATINVNEDDLTQDFVYSYDDSEVEVTEESKEQISDNDQVKMGDEK